MPAREVRLQKTNKDLAISTSAAYSVLSVADGSFNGKWSRALPTSRRSTTQTLGVQKVVAGILARIREDTQLEGACLIEQIGDEWCRRCSNLGGQFGRVGGCVLRNLGYRTFSFMRFGEGKMALVRTTLPPSPSGDSGRRLCCGRDLNCVLQPCRSQTLLDGQADKEFVGDPASRSDLFGLFWAHALAARLYVAEVGDRHADDLAEIRKSMSIVPSSAIFPFPKVESCGL